MLSTVGQHEPTSPKALQPALLEHCASGFPVVVRGINGSSKSKCCLIIIFVFGVDGFVFGFVEEQKRELQPKRSAFTLGVPKRPLRVAGTDETRPFYGTSFSRALVTEKFFVCRTSYVNLFLATFHRNAVFKSQMRCVNIRNYDPLPNSSTRELYITYCTNHVGVAVLYRSTPQEYAI